MSRPRKPFGAQHPGRLPATMMKVLAAEISDPQRLRRGKQYAKDGSVLDIVVEPGVVTCEVQGSRPTPYVAMLEVRPGDGMPLRRDLSISCTCPDDGDAWSANPSAGACKHVIAALFTLSDELLLEPELLAVWRCRVTGPDAASEAPSAHQRRQPPAAGGRHLRLVPDPEPDRAAGPVAAPPEVVTLDDPLTDWLRLPAGTALPDLPPGESVDTPVPARPELAAVLRDALATLRRHLG